MSLLRPVVRAIVVAALRSQTWAEDRVFDSDMTPLGEAILGTAKPTPYIVVYTDDDEVMSPNSRVYEGQNRSLLVVLETGVATAIKGEGENEIILEFSATDEGMEWAVDVTESQAIAALIGDPKSPWGELFKKMVFEVRKVTSNRGGQAEKGIRFAARKTVFDCRTMWDLVPGYKPDPKHPIWTFIQMVRDNPDVGIMDTSNLVEGLLTSTNAPNWREAQARLGNTTEAALALHVPGAPLPMEEEIPSYDPRAADEYTPILEEITLVDEYPVQFAVVPRFAGKGGYLASAYKTDTKAAQKLYSYSRLHVAAGALRTATVPPSAVTGALQADAGVVTP